MAGTEVTQQEVEQASGLSANTLRSLARRFSVPAAKGKYTQDDLENLIWIGERLDAGLSLGDAVTLWRSSKPEESWKWARPSAESRLTLTDALLRFDMKAASSLLDEVLSTARLEDVLVDIVQQSLIDLGTRWECGDATVEQEHYMTNFFRGRLLSWVHAFPSGTEPTTRAIAACAPDEQHEIGLLMLSLLLQIRGWSVSYLGQRVPGDKLAEAIEVIKPDVLLFSATRPDHAELLSGVAKSLSHFNLPIFFGGQAFARAPELLANTPGTVLVSDARSSVDLIIESVNRTR